MTIANINIVEECMIPFANGTLYPLKCRHCDAPLMVGRWKILTTDTEESWNLGCMECSKDPWLVSFDLVAILSRFMEVYVNSNDKKVIA